MKSNFAPAPIFVVKLTDGIEWNAKHPATFHIPTQTEKDALKVGDGCKIKLEWTPPKLVDPNDPRSAISGEGFWVRITHRSAHSFVGRIDNELVFPDVHGFVCDDELAFTDRHILSL